MHRRQYLAAASLGVAGGLAGCGAVEEVANRVDPPEFPDDPPAAAKETVLTFVRAVGSGQYESACRDRCRLQVEDGQQQIEADEMSQSDLEEWAQEAREWYGSANFGVVSAEVVGSTKMDPQAVGAQGYTAGYWLEIEYEGTGNIANPFQKGVVEADDDWWVLVGTF